MGKAATLRDARTLDDPKFLLFLQENRQPRLPWVRWSFEQMALAGFYFHPELAASRADWQALKAVEITAAQFPRSSVSLSPELAFLSGGASPWVVGLSLDVPIETGGKRDLRKVKARAESEAARLRLSAPVWALRSRIRNAWLDMVAFTWQDSSLALLVKHQKAYLEALEGKIRAGAATSPELQAGRVHLARMEAQSADLKTQAEEARIRLAAAIGLSPSSLPPAQALSFSRPSFTSKEPAPRIALTRRSDLLACLADLTAADAVFCLELAKQHSDLQLGPGFQYDSKVNKWSFSFGIELPHFNQNEGPMAEAWARREAVAQAALALQEKIAADLVLAEGAVKAAQIRTSSLAELVQAGRIRVASLQAQFATGAIEALDLLAAKADEAADQLLWEEADSAEIRAQADLEDVLQSPLLLSRENDGGGSRSLFAPAPRLTQFP